MARIPLLKALPYLAMCRCCLKKPKKDFRLAMRKALLKKMEMRMPKTDIKLEEDPFLRLGKFFITYKISLIIATSFLIFIL